MARYLKVQYRDSIHRGNQFKYIDLLATRGQIPTEANVKEALRSYAEKHDPSISLQDASWSTVHEYWELVFSRTAYYDISDCAENLKASDYAKLDFPHAAEVLKRPGANRTRYSVVTHKPKNLPLQGKFTVELILQIN